MQRQLRNVQCTCKVVVLLIGNLSKDVFERRTSTGSEAFSLLICLDANKFVLLSFFSLIKTIYPRVSTDPFPNDAKSPFRVDVRRSKTLLLKFPNINLLPFCCPRCRRSRRCLSSLTGFVWTESRFVYGNPVFFRRQTRKIC